MVIVDEHSTLKSVYVNLLKTPKKSCSKQKCVKAEFILVRTYFFFLICFYETHVISRDTDYFCLEEVWFRRSLE